MKNFFKLCGIIIVLAAAGFSLAGCDTPLDEGEQTDVFYGVEEGTTNTIELTLTAQGRSARAVTAGSLYIIKRNGTVISEGSIEVSDTLVTFTSQGGRVFTATLESGNVLIITKIVLDNGTTVAIPKLYPPVSNDGKIISDGTWSDGYMILIVSGNRFSSEFIKEGGPYPDPVGSQTIGTFTYTAEYLFRKIERQRGYYGPKWEEVTGDNRLFDITRLSETEIKAYDYDQGVTITLIKQP
jgi:hypothetical protein